MILSHTSGCACPTSCWRCPRGAGAEPFRQRVCAQPQRTDTPRFPGTRLLSVLCLNVCVDMWLWVSPGETRFSLGLVSTGAGYALCVHLSLLIGALSTWVVLSCVWSCLHVTAQPRGGNSPARRQPSACWAEPSADPDLAGTWPWPPVSRTLRNRSQSWHCGTAARADQPRCLETFHRPLHPGPVLPPSGPFGPALPVQSRLLFPADPAASLSLPLPHQRSVLA